MVHTIQYCYKYAAVAAIHRLRQNKDNRALHLIRRIFFPLSTINLEIVAKHILWAMNGEEDAFHAVIAHHSDFPEWPKRAFVFLKGKQDSWLFLALETLSCHFVAFLTGYGLKLCVFKVYLSAICFQHVKYQVMC